MTKPKPIEFDDWLELNLDSELTIEEKRCSECGGEGELTCNHCGSDYLCESCDGTGKVAGEYYLKDSERGFPNLHSVRKYYNKQVERELELYNKLMENPIDKT